MQFCSTLLTLGAIAFAGTLAASAARACEPLPCSGYTFPEDPRGDCGWTPFPVEPPDDWREGSMPFDTAR